MRLLIYGNLLPLHEPLRLAEESAMLGLACRTAGLISVSCPPLFRATIRCTTFRCRIRARGSRKPSTSSPARGPRTCFPIRANSGSYNDVALWPPLVQQPRPEIWTPVVSSKESIEFAARNGIRITPGLAPGGLQDDIIAYYAKCLAANGKQITPEHLSVGVTAYVASSKEEAIRECGPYLLYFNRTLFSHGNFTETSKQRETGYSSTGSTDYVRPENLRAAEFNRGDFRNMTMADVEKMAGPTAPGARPDEAMAEKLIRLAEHTGAGTVQVNFNRGAMPQEMFLEQIRRFARDVLPILQRHQITRVPAADAVAVDGALGTARGGEGGALPRDPTKRLRLLTSTRAAALGTVMGLFSGRPTVTYQGPCWPPENKPN